MGAMTALLSRPILRVSSPEAPPDRPLVLVAALGSAAVAVGGLVIFLGASIAGWFAADVGTVGAAMRVGALGWLVSNGSGLGGGGVSVQAVPLGFLLLFSYALYRTGRWAGATSRVPSQWYVALAALSMGACYSVIATVASLVAEVDGVSAPLGRTAASFLAVGALTGGAGLVHGSGIDATLAGRLPDEFRAALVGGAAGVLTMLALGAAVFAGSLATHFSTAVTLAEGTRSGVVGSVILALVGAALVPNAVLCAGAFVAGPGFALGTGTSVAPGDVRIGLLPDVPLLAALPAAADAWWIWALTLLPLVAGAAAALVAIRRYPVSGIGGASRRGALAGLGGGVAFGLLTVLATGAVGPGRLQLIGPDLPTTTVACALALTLGGAVAGAGRWALAAVHLVPRRSPGGRADRVERGASPSGAGEAGIDEEVTQPIRLP